MSNVKIRFLIIKVIILMKLNYMSFNFLYYKVAQNQNIFVLIIQLQFESVNSTFVHYHVWEGGLPIKTECEEFNSLFSRFLNGTDEYRNSRLKLIPRIVDGPFAVQAMVKNSPVLLGTKIKHRYYHGKNYFEIDCAVDESYISAGILKLCYRFSRNIVVDMCWVIQGENEKELPERVMCGVTLNQLDLDRIKDIPCLDKENLSWKKKKLEKNQKTTINNSSDHFNTTPYNYTKENYLNYHTETNSHSQSGSNHNKSLTKHKTETDEKYDQWT